MSDTPRTNAAIKGDESHPPQISTWEDAYDFACALERDLTAARKRVAEMGDANVRLLDRVAELEAERDEQEALLNELRALIARPRGTWTQVVGETVIRSTDDKPPEQP